MKAVVGVLVMLLKVCHGVESYCDGRQDEAQCYGALGGTVALQLMDNALHIPHFQWLKMEQEILFWSSDEITLNVIKDRSSFTSSNGTFTINNLVRSDDDKYNLKISDSNGIPTQERSLVLTIQAPVSSVLLVSECLSQVEMRVSCSFNEGDSPHYNWTLDGRTLTDAELHSGNNTTKNITLKQSVSGRLVCSISNNISSASDEKRITCGFNCTQLNGTMSNGKNNSQWVEANNTLCPVPPTTSTGEPTGILVSNKPFTNNTSTNQYKTEFWAITAGVLSAVVILLVVGVAFVCARKKNKEEKEERGSMYAEVTIMALQGRQTAQNPEMGVEYSQVNFSHQPGQTVERSTDACVYSTVQKAS